jgi:hypothetical protein
MAGQNSTRTGGLRLRGYDAAVRSRPSRWWIVLLAACAPVARAVLVDWVAASVNDVAIPESTVRRAMVLAPLPRAPGETDQAFRARVLDALIEQQLQYEEALRFGPEAPKAEEIEAAMTALSARLRAEGKDPAQEFAGSGMTLDDVRASVERQLVVSRYLRERFRTGSLADEERARAEYEGRYVPERKSAGQPVLPFEEVADQMRAAVRERSFDEEVEKWVQELREKARITIYPTPGTAAGQGAPIVLEAVPVATPTPPRAGGR